LAGFGYQSWAARARRLIGGSCSRTADHWWAYSASRSLYLQ